MRRKSYKGCDHEYMVVVETGECCACPKTFVKDIVTDEISVMWWNDQTLYTFLSSSATNDKSEQERYNWLCMSRSVADGFSLHALALLT